MSSFNPHTSTNLSARLGKTLFSTISGSASTAAHSSITYSHQRQPNVNLNQTKISRSSSPPGGVEDPISQGVTKIAPTNRSGGGFQSRFFRRQQEEAERRVQNAVREIEEIAGRELVSHRHHPHPHHPGNNKNQIPQWWYYHGPERGWSNVAPTQQQQLPQRVQQQHPPQNYNQQQQQQQRDYSTSGLMMRLVFPWFVFFLVVGEMADYFSTEMIIGAASATTVSKRVKELADKATNKKSSSSTDSEKK